MESIPYEMLASAQRNRLDRFRVSRCVDVHCHCLPGLDDGPRTPQAAVSLCRRLVEDGVTTVVATPHQLGRYNRFNSAAKIREAVEALSAELAESQIPLEIVPGGDVRIDPQVPSLLDRDEVLTVADRRRHLLLELPHELFVDPRSLLDSLLQRGIRPILTHPERYSYLHGSVDVVRSWVDRGAVIQITAGSLLGDFGSSVREMAIELVRQGLVELVATDAHDCERRTPRLSAAVKMLEASAGLEFARRVCLANPLAVFEGRDIGVEDSTES